MDIKDICNSLTKDFSENYMEKIFYFCLKKTGNNNEAENLTQDIALNILTELNKGNIPEKFHAWVWKIARNRYSVWADKKHRQNDIMSSTDICDYDIEADEENNND